MSPKQRSSKFYVFKNNKNQKKLSKILCFQKKKKRKNKVSIGIKAVFHSFSEGFSCITYLKSRPTFYFSEIQNYPSSLTYVKVALQPKISAQKIFISEKNYFSNLLN